MALLTTPNQGKPRNASSFLKLLTPTTKPINDIKNAVTPNIPTVVPPAPSAFYDM